MGSAAGPRTSRPSSGAATQPSDILVVSGEVRERERQIEMDNSSRPSHQNFALTWFLLQVLLGAQNICVKAGQAVGGRLSKLLPRRRERAAAGGNTLQRQSSTPDNVENPPDQRADTAADPNNTQNLQQRHDGDPLRGHSIISKILLGADLVLIVAIMFLEIAKPTHPYRWIAIAELSIQSTALLLMLMGFYVGHKNLSAVMWLHRTGHMLFLEGIAIAAVYRFNWSPGFIPLVLLPVPAVLIPVYLCV